MRDIEGRRQVVSNRRRAIQRVERREAQATDVQRRTKELMDRLKADDDAWIKLAMAYAEKLRAAEADRRRSVLAAEIESAELYGASAGRLRAMRRQAEREKLYDALAEVMRPDFIETWLSSPCEGLGGEKPSDVLDRGEIDRVWRVVMMMGSGMPT